MLKRTISYEDFDGNKTSDEFWFHLSKSELLELEASYAGGIEATIRRIVKMDDRAGLIAEFKRLILVSYGQKSADGKRFIKSEELREEFSQTAAYDALFIELASDADKAAEFVNGIMPRDLVNQVRTENEKLVANAVEKAQQPEGVQTTNVFGTPPTV